MRDDKKYIDKMRAQLLRSLISVNFPTARRLLVIYVYYESIWLETVPLIILLILNFEKHRILSTKLFVFQITEVEFCGNRMSKK